MSNNPPSDSPDLPSFYYTAQHVLPRVKRKDLISIGPYTQGIPYIEMKLIDGITLTIGDFCSIAAGARFLNYPDHRMDWTSTYSFFDLKSWYPKVAHIPTDVGNKVGKSIYVGNDVWIGSEAIILGGAHIGDGAVIGAHAVVAGKVPPYAIVAGNPAKVIRYRFDEQTIEALLRIKWWDWPIEQVRENVHLICDDPTELIKQFG